MLVLLVEPVGESAVEPEVEPLLVLPVAEPEVEPLLVVPEVEPLLVPLLVGPVGVPTPEPEGEPLPLLLLTDDGAGDTAGVGAGNTTGAGAGNSVSAGTIVVGPRLDVGPGPGLGLGEATAGVGAGTTAGVGAVPPPSLVEGGLMPPSVGTGAFGSGPTSKLSMSIPVQSAPSETRSPSTL